MLIELTDKVSVGDGDAEKDAARNKTFDSILVVAHDMDPTGTWNKVNRYSHQWLHEAGLGNVVDLGGVRYSHVGLIDGPGNRLAMYHAAVLALAALAARGRTLVCCHDGGRSIAVAIMYLYLMGEGPHWDEAVIRMVNSRPLGSKFPLALPHEIHKKAFTLMDWGMLTRVLSSEVSDDPE